MAKLKSRALLSSFAATAVIAGIGGLATQAHAGVGVIGVQCAAQGVQIGGTDPNSGSIAESPVTVNYSPAIFNITQVATSTSVQTGSSVTTFTNSFTLIGGTKLDCTPYTLGILKMTGLSQNSVSVSYSILPPSPDSGLPMSSGKVQVVNGVASFEFPIDGVINSSTRDVVQVSVLNAPSQVILPETIDAKFYVSNPSTSNRALVYDMKRFIRAYANDTYVYFPAAYVPATVGSTSNVIQAAYLTITEPNTAFSAISTSNGGIPGANIGVYVLNTNTGNTASGVVYCGTAADMALPSVSTNQQIDQIVIDLSKLQASCSNIGGLNLSPTAYQAGVPILLDIQGVSNPLNVTADGYSIFNAGSGYYIKRLTATVISGNPSVGTTGGTQAGY